METGYGPNLDLIVNPLTRLTFSFIVLQHDLYEITVDLAMGFTLPLALSYNPKLTVRSSFYLSSDSGA